jgi:hypothetical protein
MGRLFEYLTIDGSIFLAYIIPITRKVRAMFGPVVLGVILLVGSFVCFFAAYKQGKATKELSEKCVPCKALRETKSDVSRLRLEVIAAILVGGMLFALAILAFWCAAFSLN